MYAAQLESLSVALFFGDYWPDVFKRLCNVSSTILDTYHADCFRHANLVIKILANLTFR